MTYAIIRSGGKQYKVQPGDVVEVEQLSTNPNEKHTFSDVLLFVGDGSPKFGNPIVSGVTVVATVLEHVKGDKIRVSKFKAKAKYRRTTGHRQHLTKIKIESVGDAKAESKPQKTETKNQNEKKMENATAKPTTTKTSKPATKRSGTTKTLK